MRMTLVDVTRLFPFHANCLGCQTFMKAAKDLPPVYADLHGEPFKAYYCGECAQKKIGNRVLPVGKEEVLDA